MRNSKLIESQNSIHLNENDTIKKLADHDHHVYHQDSSNYDDISDWHNTKEKQRYVENKRLEEIITTMIKVHKTKISSTPKYLILKEINY